jgi:hypothetical protein
MAYGICRRVYSENDRRELSAFERPLPGAAREYWPTDLTTWDASEGYGWGATTASYVIRQLCGFYEAETAAGCAFRLAPSLGALLGDGELRLGPLPYRGRLLRLAYRAHGDDCRVRIELDTPAGLRATDERTGAGLREAAAATAHELVIPAGRGVLVALGR